MATPPQPVNYWKYPPVKENGSVSETDSIAETHRFDHYHRKVHQTDTHPVNPTGDTDITFRPDSGQSLDREHSELKASKSTQTVEARESEDDGYC